jgi:hypothetical protein
MWTASSPACSVVSRAEGTELPTRTETSWSMTEGRSIPKRSFRSDTRDGDGSRRVSVPDEGRSLAHHVAPLEASRFLGRRSGCPALHVPSHSCGM